MFKIFFLFVFLSLSLIAEELIIDERKSDKKAKTSNQVKPCFRCKYVMVQLIDSTVFRNSEYYMHPTVTIPASALSSLCEQRR